jgi:hypothetical protein
MDVTTPPNAKFSRGKVTRHHAKGDTLEREATLSAAR